MYENEAGKGIVRNAEVKWGYLNVKILKRWKDILKIFKEYFLITQCRRRQ